MPELTIDKFDRGIDRRKGQFVSDANRLRVANNVFVNTGQALQKRPGLNHQGLLHADSVGLFGSMGQVNTFSGGASALTHPAGGIFVDNPLRPATAYTPTQVWFASVFSGFFFVVAEDAGGDQRAFYLDGGGADDEVGDANCPVNKATEPTKPGCLQIATRIFMTDNELISFCELDDPTDWTTGVGTATGAGFLAVGRQAKGQSEVTALGQYQGDMIALFPDSAQSWDVDADATLNFFQQSIDGVGSIYPRTADNLASDLFFLSSFGFRSISLLSLTNNLADVDVGTAIEDLIKTAIAGVSNEPFAQTYAGGGQYIGWFDDEAFVYSFSRTAKISAWTRYTFPAAISDATTLNSELYVRSGQDCWKFDASKYNDDDAGGSGSSTFEARAEMAFLDFKKPGHLKYVSAFDVVMEGSAQVSFKYTYIDDMGDLQTATTTAIDVSSNTRPGELIPLEVTVTELAPIFVNNANEDWRLDALTLHYENLGPIS